MAQGNSLNRESLSYQARLPHREGTQMLFREWAAVDPNSAEQARGKLCNSDYCKDTNLPWIANDGIVEGWPEQDFLDRFDLLSSLYSSSTSVVKRFPLQMIEQIRKSEETTSLADPIRYLAAKDPEAALAEVQCLPELCDRLGLRAAIARGWASHDPEAALAWALQTEECENSEFYESTAIYGAFLSIAEADRTKAIERMQNPSD